MEPRASEPGVLRVGEQGVQGSGEPGKGAGHRAADPLIVQAPLHVQLDEPHRLGMVCCGDGAGQGRSAVADAVADLLAAVQVAQGDVVDGAEHRGADRGHAAGSDVAFAVAGVGSGDEGVGKDDRPCDGASGEVGTYLVPSPLRAQPDGWACPRRNGPGPERVRGRTGRRTPPARARRSGRPRGHSRPPRCGGRSRSVRSGGHCPQPARGVMVAADITNGTLTPTSSSRTWSNRPIASSDGAPLRSAGERRRSRRVRCTGQAGRTRRPPPPQHRHAPPGRCPRGTGDPTPRLSQKGSPPAPSAPVKPEATYDSVGPAPFLSSF